MLTQGYFSVSTSPSSFSLTHTSPDKSNVIVETNVQSCWCFSVAAPALVDHSVNTRVSHSLAQSLIKTTCQPPCPTGAQRHCFGGSAAMHTHGKRRCRYVICDQINRMQSCSHAEPCSPLCAQLHSVALHSVVETVFT